MELFCYDGYDQFCRKKLEHCIALSGFNEININEVLGAPWYPERQLCSVCKRNTAK